MKVFISHASRDNPIVIRIITKLDGAGIQKWVDIEEINRLDSTINESVNDGLRDSDYFLLVWSKHADASINVKREYNAAISSDYDSRLAKIIIRLDDTPLPPLLADRFYRKIQEDELETTLDEIIHKMKESKLHQKQRRFDNFIDGTYNPVEIVEESYKSSHAFKHVDYQRYKKEVEGWDENG